jgi:hypothetical protein
MKKYLFKKLSKAKNISIKIIGIKFNRKKNYGG